MKSKISFCMPVILCGGAGTRLWPLSRTQRPKQFLKLTGERTLFQLTLERIAGFVDPIAPIVVANDDHRFMVAEQCQEQGVLPSALILEPVARNTAPAIAIAALCAQRVGGDPVLLVLPSDHMVSDVTAFESAVALGYGAAENGAMVVFGITPTTPEPGYGYVKTKDGIRVSSNQDAVAGIQHVEVFVEKPDIETARKYLASGSYYWNSGMFMFRASTYLAELEASSPDILSACAEALDHAKRDPDFIRLDEQAFAKSPSDSIDYAVMEKTKNAALVPLDAGWSDVGAWAAVWQMMPQDNEGNVMRGDVLADSSTNCYVHADHRLVSLLGMESTVVIETADAVLVAHRDKSQDIKQLVDRMKAQNRSEAKNHRRVLRPWGSYDSIDRGERYQVKRITVKPGAKLSLQMHHHRSEHWVVVRGTALVHLSGRDLTLAENQSVYVPAGEKHSLENIGKTELELIEVQSGSYLGEDDIVRFEDRYGRV